MLYITRIEFRHQALFEYTNVSSFIVKRGKFLQRVNDNQYFKIRSTARVSLLASFVLREHGDERPVLSLQRLEMCLTDWDGLPTGTKHFSLFHSFWTHSGSSE